MGGNIMADKQNILFRLRSIENESTTDNISAIDLSQLSGDNLVFQYKMETLVKLSSDEIIAIPSIKYSYEGHSLFEITVHFVFSVQNLKSIIKLDAERNEINVSADIFPTIVSASYSSLRGIVYARTIDTPLNVFPIPMIEISTLMSKNGINVIE